ncbi:hypothetical protein LOTGIDRAFT_231896 [Lottia gigantea]|uniref:AMOP domain-containing protein n=1 Tax=Lottia gigantea TaxID=225164 RepID=V4ALM9_LOTGI|nr:hypothetical protein LOTGIDRAFT_231896 [Lottia gigantea]ESO95665.1 hypothetical protein LOTGIDRAFT_231896 [Lottia gigantea]
MSLFAIILILSLFVISYADIHLQNPRGSGNRLDENGRERRNRQRLFNSQANDRQGYNVGSLYYLQGSTLQVEWTNQHSCNGPNSNCDIILQYMCDDKIRDGSLQRETIPDRNTKCENDNCNTDIKYSMHEDYDYYTNCRLRHRNMGLFTGDLNFGRRNRAISTRLDMNGRRYGYECNEEREYYPYWHPTPWKDIAVLTDRTDKCDYYAQNSENVKGRGYCKISETLIKEQDGKIVIPNNEEDCEKFRFPENNPDGEKGEWVQAPSHGIEAPVCQQAEYSRDNHNGNGVDGKTMRYNWTIPEFQHEKCILRIRYNVTSDDFDGWETTSENNAVAGKFDEGARVPVYENLGWESRCDAFDRSYYMKNLPQVQVFEGLPDLKLQLAIRTNQFGRVFQDRSFSFAIRPRPADVPAAAKIHNLNVRGKRGNIVQTYPSTEYDFVPNDLVLNVNDYYHVQWTGSNSNNNGNAGQGQAGSDRSNLVFLHEQVYPEGSGYSGPGIKVGQYGMNYPMNATELNGIFDMQTLQSLAFNMPNQLGGEMSLLDDAGTYFDLGPIKAPQSVGVYHYMCTRNNAFTNRDQKGRIFVTDKDEAPARRNLEPAASEEEKKEIRQLLELLQNRS